MREEPGPNAWLDLRDAASAVRLAVQMLNGPLAPWSEPAPDLARMREIIGALDQATRRVCALVTTLQPSANDRPTVAVMPTPVVAQLSESPAPVPTVPESLTIPRAAVRPRPPVRAPAEPAAVRPRLRPAKPAVPGPATDIDAMLHQLEITVVTRSDPPTLLSVHANPGLRTGFDHGVLMQTLVRMVEDAAVLGPAPDATVTLRVYLDPAEELGDAMDVVFELHPDPRAPAATLAWTGASASIAPPGATATSRLVDGRWCAQLRVPALVRDPFA